MLKAKLQKPSSVALFGEDMKQLLQKELKLQDDRSRPRGSQSQTHGLQAASLRFRVQGFRALGFRVLGFRV